MGPTDICDRIISDIKTSNLNFHLQETPYSATITLKKTFVNRRNAEPQIFKHELAEGNKLQRDLIEKSTEIDDKNSVIDTLDNKLQKCKNELEEFCQKMLNS